MTEVSFRLALGESVWFIWWRNRTWYSRQKVSILVRV